MSVLESDASAAAVALARVLIVDDDAAVRALLRRILAQVGFEVFEAADGEGAQSLFGQNTDDFFDVVVSDVDMPRVNGFELLEWMTQTHPSLPVIMISGGSGMALTERLQAMGAFDVLGKPFTLDDVQLATLRAATAAGGGSLRKSMLRERIPPSAG